MKQGEVWLINLDPTLGAEIRKIRPAVIVNDDVLGKLPLRVVVPLTDWKDRYSIVPWMVNIESDSTNGLTKTSSADCFQVRSVSETRFIKKIGDLDHGSMEAIREALKKVLTIE